MARSHGRPAPPELLARIDALDLLEQERGRLPILAESAYVDFASAALGVERSRIRELLDELHADGAFFDDFVPRLARIDDLASAGDLRLHSVTCYLAARTAGDGLVIETGVASGKSSTYFLLGLAHAAQREGRDARLVSIDLPPDGALAADGSDTDLEGRDVGWLVPAHLRDRWTLLLGHSSELLPAAIADHGPPDVFLHDSLHTLENTTFELETALRANPSVVLLCDNLELGSGEAFADVTRRIGRAAHTFGNFGVARPGD